MRQGWQLCVMLLVAVFIATTGGAAVKAAPGPSGRIVIVQGPDPVSLDPTLDINKTSYNIQLGIYDPLIRVFSDGKPNPWIATEWKATNPTTWQIKIREGVKFHNGEPLNAESVVFSINTYNASKGEGNKYFKFVTAARALDARTIEIRTDGPVPATPVHLGFLFVLPKGAYTQLGPERFGTQPVGSGPMKFSEWRQGVQITLVRHDAYWRGNLPFAEAIYRPAPEASTRVALLETGQADVIANVPPELIDRIARRPDASVQRTPSLRKIFLEFNMKQKPFDDVRVRRAVNHAIDKDALIQSVLGGNAVREYGPVPDGWLGSNPIAQLTAYDYNPARARQLLAEAGYAGGVTIDFWHPIGRYLKDKEVTEAIVAMLQEVGIRSNVRGMDIGSLVQRIHTQTLSGLHFFSWAPLIFDTDNLWRAHFYSQGLNQYAVDAKTDQLLLAGAATSDRRERQRLYSELERYVVNEMVPWAFLYRQSLIYGVSNKVSWQPRADEVIDVRLMRLK
jgi:peptide/nickel transport system substrate-binding protein